jgi:hypothetical protein
MAADSAASTAVDAAQSAASNAESAAVNALQEASDALTVEHFDAAKADALIAQSALDLDTKTALKAEVAAAAKDPAKVPEAVAHVRAALGLSD